MVPCAGPSCHELKYHGVLPSAWRESGLLGTDEAWREWASYPFSEMHLSHSITKSGAHIWGVTSFTGHNPWGWARTGGEARRAAEEAAYAIRRQEGYV